MARPAPAEPSSPRRYTRDAYFGLVSKGVLGPDDRVELLEGVIVSMSPQSPPHAAAMSRAARAFHRAIGDRGAIRVQLPLVLGEHSVPEPDVAVVSGRESDYDRVHPTSALLVVEVADSSLVQDRLTKAALYAAAGVSEYWIVNLRDDRIEVNRAPDAATATYTRRSLVRRGERLELVALPGASVTAESLLPTPPSLA
jgi:Uma2 family endonuclease